MRCLKIGAAASKFADRADFRGTASNGARSCGDALAELLIAATGMSLPRQVLPGQFYMITRRCTQRQFLLRPDPTTNNAFTYCLIEAAQRCEVNVLLPCAMSNHHHAVIFDRCGRYPEFVEHSLGRSWVLRRDRDGLVPLVRGNRPQATLDLVCRVHHDARLRCTARRSAYPAKAGLRTAGGSTCPCGR